LASDTGTRDGSAGRVGPADLLGNREIAAVDAGAARWNSCTMPNIDLESYEHVRLHRDGPVLTATITNPEKKNAVNRGITGDFQRLWRDVDADEDVRVVVLTGAGNAFCAGVDLRIAHNPGG